MKKLLLLLDSKHWKEEKLRKPLGHGGGQLLQMCLKRLSIGREHWVHDYCCEDKEMLSKKKKERTEELRMDVRRIRELIRLNDPCVVIGMGKLSCEILTGASLISSRAGTCWKTSFGTVWITFSPDAALFDPTIVVEIYGVLAKAAERAGIPTEFNPKVPMFDFEEYEHEH